MIHHQSDLCLRVGGYIDTLMDNAADHLMMRLTASLLVRSRCIAVKHPAAAVLVGIEFDALRVRELAAVICQKYREQLNEGIWAKLKIHAVKDIDHGLCIVVVAAERELQAGRRECDRQEHSTALDAFYRIKLDHRGIRMLTHILLVVVQRAAFPALGIHLDRIWTLTAWTEPHLAGHVDVLCCKQSCVHVGVQSPLTDHQLVHMVQADVMQ